jgi:hypothetical protein
MGTCSADVLAQLTQERLEGRKLRLCITDRQHLLWLYRGYAKKFVSGLENGYECGWMPHLSIAGPGSLLLGR